MKYTVVVKEITEKNDEHYGSYMVVEMVNNIRYAIGEHISKNEVKVLTFKPAYKVVVR
jgi:hypothetical protein